MPSTTMTIDQLDLSPHNVRKNHQDKTAVQAIERSLAAKGLMMPLLVHPWRGRKDKWGVFAGGRRWRAFRNLIDRGELPADYGIDVVVRDLSDAELAEMSLSENLLRRDLRPYEEYAAVLTAQKRGHDVDTIAEALGQEPGWVKRALRLATLAPPLLAALETERLSVRQAEAFGATEDHGAQLAAWQALCGNGDMVAAQVQPAQIRAQLKVGDQELGRLLRFVGDDAYRAAGGRFELDLFADQAEQRGRVTDEQLLRGLVAGRLDEVRAEQRALAGRDVRFQGKPPQTTWGTTDFQLQIEPEHFDNGPFVLPKGDVVGTIDIGQTGEAEVRWWWASHAAKRGKKPAAAKEAAPATLTTSQRYTPGSVREGAAIGQSYDNSRQLADAQLKEQEGLTADGVQIVRSLRRAILRAALVDDAQIGGTLAADYLVWAQLRMHLSSAGQHGHAESSAEVGMQRLGSADPDGNPARPHLDATIAEKTWRMALTLLKRQSFLTAPDLVHAFRDYREAQRPLKDLAAGVVAALALERSLDADGYRIPLHDELAAALQLTRDGAIRRYWQPTAAFLELLPLAERRAIAEPFMEEKAFAGWARLKGAELTPMVLRTVEGTAPSMRQSTKAHATRWVHPLLEFIPGDRTLAEAFADQDDAQHGLELAEAAE